MLQILLLVASVVAAGAMVVGANHVQAKNGNGNHAGWSNQEQSNNANDQHAGPSSQSTLPDRPGNGFGDKNHNHTGPPGGQSTFPGNGFGDENHDHSGPPGQN